MRVPLSWLRDFADFPGFNAVYLEFFEPPLPARTTVQAGLYGFRIEVEATARCPDPSQRASDG